MFEAIGINDLELIKYLIEIDKGFNDLNKAMVIAGEEGNLRLVIFF